MFALFTSQFSAMKISRPRLRNSKDNEETARTTRSSSTPRSLRQSDLSIMRTQTSGLKRDIADLKRQTKELKKKSPTITRQTRTETKRGIQRLGPSEETASLDSALLDNDSFTMSSDVTDTQESTGGCYDKLYENETAYGVSCSLTKAGIVNGECESKVSQAEDKEDDEMSFNDVDSDDARVEVSTADGNEGTRGKRRKRRRRFMPKKKPKLATYSADDVVNSDSRLGKRGRKHQTERCEGANGSSKLDTDREMTSKEDTTRTSIIRELQTSKGFVDKVELNELLPMRRTPRMASLNAIAKVNAVLESYSANGGKTVNDLRDKNNHKKSSEYGLRSKEEKSRKRSTSSVTQTDDIIFFTSVKGEHKEWMMSGSGDVFHQAAEEQPISDSMVSSTSNLAAEEENTTTKDKAVQTVVNHKAVQTDLLLFENSVTANSPSSCTCGYLENVNSLEHRSPSQDSDDLNWVPQHVPCTVYRIPPTISSNTLNVPLCSSLSTKTTTHTIAIPFTKTHILEHTEMKDFEESTNLSTQSNKRMASLNAVAMMNAIKILDRPLFGDTDEGTAVSSRGREFERSERRHLGQIRIPRITYQATSTSKFSMGGKSKMGNVVRASQMKSLSNHLEHLIESKKQTFKPSNKVCLLNVTEIVWRKTVLRILLIQQL